MDAVEFLKTRARMCKKTSCSTCSLHTFCVSSFQAQSQDAENGVAIVEKWAKEHTIKTQQSEFLKQWPEAEIAGDGLIAIWPCQLHTNMAAGGRLACQLEGNCDKCRRDFWLKEVE